MFTSVSLLIGIILILGALALFFMDRLRPAYARESDKVYAILIFVAGIMTVPDVDMGLGHAFTLMILGGVTTSIVIDNLRLRGPNSEDASLGKSRRDVRPPRPRYEERPPVQRGYRAELDNQGFDNRGPALRDRPAPRMNPAQPPYPQGAYANNGEVRPPYEEYRGPAGRLQPSRAGNAGAPPDSRYSDNGWYGDRPPVPQRPPQNQRPPQRENQRPYEGPSGLSEEGNNNQPDTRIPEARTGERPPRRPRSDSGPREGQSAMGNSLSNSAENSLRNDEENGQRNGSENSPSPTRALNVRPLSEAPKFDDDYRSGSSPEGAPSY